MKHKLLDLTPGLSDSAGLMGGRGRGSIYRLDKLHLHQVPSWATVSSYRPGESCEERTHSRKEWEPASPDTGRVEGHADRGR